MTAKNRPQVGMHLSCRRNVLFATIILAVALHLYADDRAPLRPPKHGIYVVAHRGAHKDIPENTLAAYKKAIELGCDFVEIDVRRTADGKLVSMHNAKVDAYTEDAQGFVKQFTLAQLKALDIGSRVGPQWSNERIPTLEEILEVCKGKIGVYLDLKEAPVEEVLACIGKWGMERDVWWYGAPTALEEVQKKCGECVIMPDPGMPMFLPNVLKRFSPRVVATSFDQTTAELVAACHAAGAIVVMDDDGPESWEKAVAMGVDGIQTDHPAELISFLRERGKDESQAR